MTRLQKWLLASVLILSVFFRFYQIAVMPGGLFPDEAANGLDINLMQKGQLQPFYERGNGREALFFYMLWGSVEAFGKGPWQHHIVSALVGVLAVLGCFLVTRKLFSLNEVDPQKIKRATNIALLASFFMAVSTWHIVLSRTAFRANLIPLFAPFTVYFGLLAYSALTRRSRYAWAAVTGATFALGFYTYIAYRIFVPILAIAVLWPLLVDWFKGRFEFTKKFLGPALFLILSFAIFIAPLAHYFYTHPGSFIGRSGQVSIFNPELNQGKLLPTLGEVTRLSVQAYFVDGDLNWRHNISGQPFLSSLISLFFAIGIIGSLILAIWYFFRPLSKAKYWKFFLLAGWFWGMLIPVVTTAEGIPHGLRSIGTIPPVFILSAWGLYLIVEGIQKFSEKYHEPFSSWKARLVRSSVFVLTMCFVVALITQSYYAYFVYAANSPEYQYAFRADLTTVSDYLNKSHATVNSNKTNTYLVLDKFSVQTVDYLTSLNAADPSDPVNQPYTQVDPENSWELQNLNPGDLVVFCQSSLFDITKFKIHHPNTRLKLEARNTFGQTVMAVYEVTKK
ncbi:MAG: glycosyltransferase family 39 protein [Candidatus Doudnabacteria bacterium]|nr:glycosyltransferase family 39 protein [Candidatus Doudnabacteria bacterium]